MSTPAPDIRVRVDVTNPGQFFACCGLLELAHRLWPGACGSFADGEFRVARAGGGCPSLSELIGALRSTDIKEGKPDADKALQRVHMTAFGLTLDWWVDASGAKTALKLWAGHQTSAGIVETLKGALPECDQPASLPGLFEDARPLTGRFGFDPRSAWNALDAGFSPNEQGIPVATFPAVELLAAVGLQRCRPVQAQDGSLLYATWTVPVPAILAPAASAGLLPVGDTTRYRFRIVGRGSYKAFDFATPFRS